MTPQIQPIVDGAGVVHIVGNDTFCISALQALEALAFDGPITMLNFCLSDATRQAFPSGFLEGIEMPATAPPGEDPASALYREVMDTFATTEIDFSSQTLVTVFVLFAGIDVALDGLDGDVTPESVIEAMHSMEKSELPNGGGIRFLCDGNSGGGTSGGLRRRRPEDVPRRRRAADVRRAGRLTEVRAGTGESNHRGARRFSAARTRQRGRVRRAGARARAHLPKLGGHQLRNRAPSPCTPRTRTRRCARASSW